MTPQAPQAPLGVAVHQRRVHRSFRLSRPGRTGVDGRLVPTLVLRPDAAVGLLDAAVREDVTLGGRWSVWSGGLQLWNRPWDGPAGSRGSASYLGCLDWVHDQPQRHELSITRVRLSPHGVAAGLTADGLLQLALSLRP